MDALLLATCRANPESIDQHDHVPLAAGHYRLLLMERAKADGSAKSPCGCASCEATPGFVVREHPRALPQGDIILVIHGFNCTEVGALQTAFNVRDALAAWDLPLAAPRSHATDDTAQVVAFTWPCEHTLVPGYMADKEAVARFAAFSLTNLITDLRAAEPTRRIHIVAHSMGCFLTLKALNMLAVLHGLRGSAQSGSLLVTPVVQSVIWLAPDVNADALERSTPAVRRQRGWSYPTRLRALHHFTQALARPRAIAQSAADLAPHAATAPGSDAQFSAEHPLDGYGYAALDVLTHLAIYTSLRDEALWVSPLANRATEESGSASGLIRLGWCGPLHPGLMMAPDGDAQHRQRDVTLLDCTDVAYEHGTYFFEPVVQRDLAARLGLAQRAPRPLVAGATLVRASAPDDPQARLTLVARPTLTPPPERIALAAWHLGAKLQFPLAGAQIPHGLTLWRLQPANASLPDGTAPRPNAPAVDPTSGTARLRAAWQFPLTAWILRLWVSIWRWYFRV
jgi:hypothetical protein